MAEEGASVFALQRSESWVLGSPGRAIEGMMPQGLGGQWSQSLRQQVLELCPRMAGRTEGSGRGVSWWGWILGL